jgi:hypothetical protein
MQLTLKLDIGNGPYEVTTNLWCAVQWERKYKRKMSDLAQGIGAEDLAYLAFEASKLHNVTVPVVFDDFIKKLAAMPEVVEQEDPNPTEGATD